ncbi:MAG: hypothetical protein QXU18_10360 [Thermoplasmatales archaeon]
MGKILDIFLCSHAPQLVSKPKLNNEYQSQIEKVQNALVEVGEKIKKIDPDTVILFGADHLESYFLDNYPTIMIPIVERTNGRMFGEDYEYDVDITLAKTILLNLLKKGFDPSFSQRFKLDHPFRSPLKYIFKNFNKPIIPIHVNSNIFPVISVQRAYDLGSSIRNIILSESKKNVVVIGTGGLSHYPGTPLYGKVDLEFDNYILELLHKGKADEILSLDPVTLENSGNIELRTWIAAMGFVRNFTGNILAHIPTFHIDYAVMELLGDYSCES